MAFFIKKGDTLPELKFQLTQRLMYKHDITDKMMENIAVTFSMIDKHSGQFRVANVSAGLKINEEYHNIDDPKYELSYKFKSRDTRKEGEYYGEFKIDFLGDSCGSITFPTTNYLPIYVTKGITKTTVKSASQAEFNTFDNTFDVSFF